MLTSENNHNFDPTEVKNELQHLIQGNGGEGAESTIQAAARHLRGCKKASATSEGLEYSKEQETKELVTFIDRHHLWFPEQISEINKIGRC